MPELSARDVEAKQVSQVCEELGHLKAHETSHNKRVVDPTIRCMIRHIPKRSLRSSFIQDKMEALKSHPPD